jgi:hypothetical protein
MKKAIFLIILPVTLGGCAIADRIQSRADYRESSGQYKACLAANPASPQSCEAARLAMETDERRFTNIGAAASGHQGSANITVLNR